MFVPWLNKYNLLIFDKIDSTNCEAIRLAKAHVDSDFIIWAQEQTAGRGRYAKQWHSKRGNFYLSLLLSRDIPISMQPQLSFVTALAIYDTVQKTAQKAGVILQLKLKWPNDILISDHKLGGILLESINIRGVSYVIIGVGLNLLSSPHNLGRRVTSLHEHKVNDINVDRVLDTFITTFDEYFATWCSNGFSIIRKEWIRKSGTIGAPITFNNGTETISGIFQDIDNDGNICIENSAGLTVKFSTGEVFFEHDNPNVL